MEKLLKNLMPTFQVHKNQSLCQAGRDQTLSIFLKLLRWLQYATKVKNILDKKARREIEKWNTIQS